MNRHGSRRELITGGLLLVIAGITLPGPGWIRAALLMAGVIVCALDVVLPERGDPPRGAHPDEEAAIRAARLHLGTRRR